MNYIGLVRLKQVEDKYRRFLGLSERQIKNQVNDHNRQDMRRHHGRGCQTRGDR